MKRLVRDALIFLFFAALFDITFASFIHTFAPSADAGWYLLSYLLAGPLAGHAMRRVRRRYFQAQASEHEALR
jgi:hypothetical protein